MITPTFVAKNIFEVNPDFYKKINVKYLLIDLDNTLDPYNVYTPSKRVVELINNLKENGLIPIITSNNSKKRLNKYCKDLNINFLYYSMKPYAFRVKKLLKKMNIKLDDCIMLGDQLYTDIKFANRLKIKSILFERLSEEESIVTKFNRYKDIKLRKKLLNNGKIKYWKDYE